MDPVWDIYRRPEHFMTPAELSGMTNGPNGERISNAAMWMLYIGADPNTKRNLRKRSDIDRWSRIIDREQKKYVLNEDRSIRMGWLPEKQEYQLDVLLSFWHGNWWSPITPLGKAMKNRWWGAKIPSRQPIQRRYATGY